MPRLIALLIVILLNCLVFGQSQYNFHQLTVEDGLSQSINSFLYTDRQGFTWISSLDGINMFDGRTVKVFKPNPKDPFSLKGANIQSSFFEDAKGNIWFTTNEALNCYRKEYGNFINRFERDFSISKGVNYAFHLENDRFLWITFGKKLYRYDTWNYHSSDTAAFLLDEFHAIRSAVATDNKGRVTTVYGCHWNPKPGFEIIHFASDLNSFSRRTWFDKPGNPANFTLTVSQVIPENENAAWFVTDKGVLYFDEENPEQFILIPPPLKEKKITNIISFSSDHLWALSGSSKIFTIDRSNKNISYKDSRLFNLDERKSIEKIDRLFALQDSILWVASYGNGVYFSNIYNQKFTNVFYKNGMHEKKADYIYETLNGEVWCITFEGEAWKFNDRKRVNEKGDFPRNLMKMTNTNDVVWNISAEGLGKYVDQDNQFINIQPTKNVGRYFDLINFNDRFLILGTHKKGIIFFDKIKNQILPSVYKDWTVKIYLDSQNHLWSANTSRILTAWEVNQTDNINLLKLKEFPPLGLINDIIEDYSRKVIWVGTSKGLVRINAETLQQDTIITEQDGLPNQFINSVVLDKRGRLWLSTNKGIIRYLPEAPTETRFKHFTSRDGLSSDEYLPGSKLLSRNGEIWFGSTKGVDVFDPNNISNIGRVPKLVINSLRIHDQEWESDTAIEMTHHIQLKHNQNTLTFGLSAIEYTDPLRNVFKAFLKHGNGIDSSYLGISNKITYANLRPGDYIFQFTAANAEGIWNPESKKLKITILSPWYLTWWFITLCILTILCVIGYIVFLQVLRIVAIQRIRNKLSRDMHDDLGSVLTTIGMDTNRALFEQKNYTEVLTVISDKVNRMMGNMYQLVWATNPANDYFESVIEKMREIGEETLPTNVSMHVKLDELLHGKKLAGDCRYNLQMLFKEAITNVTKYAEASKIDLILKPHGKNLFLEIIDDGVGFNPQRPATQKNITGNGLHNMRQRADKLGGSLEIISLPGKGTKIRLEFPIKQKYTLRKLFLEIWWQFTRTSDTR